MADLTPLIRLHKYELDEKKRVLAAFYGEMALLERARRELEEAFQREKEALAGSEEVQFTFANYAAGVQRKREEIDKSEIALEKKIERAKESMMETFSELKKYEMTQEERERLEEEERRIREGKIMDEIGLETYRRRES